MVRGLSKAVRAAAKAATSEQRDEPSTWNDYPSGPRSFPYDVKEACWAKAEPVKGRDPARWRRDAVGNIVFRKLLGCQGCLCHDYDHIVPYSKEAQAHLTTAKSCRACAGTSKSSKRQPYQYVQNGVNAT